MSEIITNGKCPHCRVLQYFDADSMGRRVICKSCGVPFGAPRYVGDDVTRDVFVDVQEVGFTSSKNERHESKALGWGVILMCAAFLFAVSVFAFSANRASPPPAAETVPVDINSRPEADEKTVRSNARSPELHRSIPNYAASEGKSVLDRILADNNYHRHIAPTLWGGLTPNPNAAITIPQRDWNRLSTADRHRLGYYIKSLVPEMKANPSYSGVPETAPVFSTVVRNCGRMTRDSWCIHLGHWENGGLIIDQIAVNGTQLPWVSDSPVEIEPRLNHGDSKGKAAQDTNALASAKFRGVKMRAEAGSKEAMKELSELYRKGEGVESDEGEARVWELRAENSANK